MQKPQLLLISSSRCFGHGYLEVAAKEIIEILQRNDVKSVLFIPYALKDYNKYLKLVEEPFKKWGYEVNGIHNSENPLEAVTRAEAIFIGGGNTFRLLKQLYDLHLVELIRKRVLGDGIPYIGASAGTNVATKSINTTNDMPIVYPPTFDALKLVPFNINPHYLDPDTTTKHKGETREERILQYLEEPDSCPVLGLREGASLLVNGETAILKGLHGARLFVKDSPPQELETEANLSNLLNQ